MDNSEPDPSTAELKKFLPTSRHQWPGVTDEEWNDYRWQLRNSIRSLSALEKHLVLAPEERAGVLLTESKLAMAITPYFFSLIDPHDPEDPIRRQVIPRIEETQESESDMADPCGEDSHMPVSGLVHRYPDRVLFLVTDRCASYCRYCTRSRVVSGAGDQHLETDFDRAIRYIREHTEIRDVLLSGGDPLLLGDDKLDYILGELRAIPHVEFLRIGSRIPIFLPQRITPELCGILRKHHPLWMSIHTNHPRELTVESRAGIGRLVDAGIPLGNQAVLLRGVNDDVPVMKALMHKLLMSRVRPYYIYQCDLIKGSSHLRTSVRKGLEIMENLRGHTTGYGVPTYVIDAPGGGGKVPVMPDYIIDHDAERIMIRNYEGKIYEYPEPEGEGITIGEPEYELDWHSSCKW
ncbi:lysine 2,3-aminomutase [Oscillatoria laete-virens NRMC-F 0139]|nr:lysine 2,3-aminomutase [Oscillatoria laete-virens]MDL5054465.1 lysine 2,3-aminomutase [Oscillatoria laete-virens NRMC-F 0139]